MHFLAKHRSRAKVACPRALKGHCEDKEMIYFYSKCSKKSFRYLLKKKFEKKFEKKIEKIFSNKFWYFWASKYKTFGFFLHSLSIWYNIWCPYVPMGMPIIQTSVLGITGIARFPKRSVLGKTGIVNALWFCKWAGKSGHGHALYHHYYVCSCLFIFKVPGWAPIYSTLPW